jgi:transposase-like protein
MSVSTNRSTKPRVPLEFGGVQVNFCKNPGCVNYGVPASTQEQPKGPGASARGRDRYKKGSGHYDRNRKGAPRLECLDCGEKPPIKSNQGVVEEKQRVSAYLQTYVPSCPNVECGNHGVAVSAEKGRYYGKGVTSAGSPRYLCRACNRSFSINVSKPAKNHKLPHKNFEIFQMLVNTVPMRRICKIAVISQKTLYDKIKFLHQQTMAFAARRERRLLTGEVVPEKLYLSVDRQDHMVNWSNRKDKRQTQFQAIGTADNESSYVFGIHLNYDPRLSPENIETDAQACGDYEEASPLRRYARLWLQGDYTPAMAEKAITTEIMKDCGHFGVEHAINQTYAEALARDDVEAFDLPAECSNLPNKGMQVHAEYTLYGHFFFLSELFQHVGKLRFFLDQESGIRAACLSSFQERILARECDAFYVSINKSMTNDQKEKAMREVRYQVKELAEKYPYELHFGTLRRMLIAKEVPNGKPVGPWRDIWVDVLSRIKSEPEKKVCHLTHFNDYDNDHMASLMDMASLHGVDRFFAQIRNSLSLLSRAPNSASNTGRRWFQRNAYNPEVVAMLLDIYRVNYNYLEVGDDKMTPAMRLGLAKSKVRLTDILSFHEGGRPN